MHAGAVEQVGAVRHAQKARALLKRLGSKPLDLEQLPAVFEPAVLLAVSGYIFGNRVGHARNTAQKRRGGGIQIHTDRVDAVLDHAVQRFGQARLRHVMLVLSHADGLWVDLDQLGERILQAPRDGHRRTERHVEIREFLRAQLGGRIHGCARLGYDHIGNAAAVLTNEVRDKDLALLGGRAVADGDAGDVMPVAQAAQDAFGFLGFVVRRGGIDDRGLEHLAGRVHNGQLAAGAVGRVKAERHTPAHGRLQEQRTQVERKVVDGLLVCRFGQLAAQLALERGEQQAVPAVRADRAQPAAERIFGVQRRAGDCGDGFIFVNHQRDLELALFFAAVDRKHTVALQTAHRFRKVVIHGIGRVVRIRADGFEHPSAMQQRAQTAAQVSIVRQVLGDDVARACERVLGGLYTPFRIDIGLCQRFQRRGGSARRENGGSERLQPLFARDGRTGAALGAVGAVQVVERSERLRPLNGGSQFVGQLALRLDRIPHLSAALVQPAQIGKALGQPADGLVVHCAVHLLAVARDERHGVAVIQQRAPHFRHIALSARARGRVFE